MKRHILFILINAVLLNSCDSPKWDVSLYSQQIEGSRNLIYEYNAWGGRDSHIFGFAILDSSKKFDINKRLQLPGRYFEGKPHADGIKMIVILKEDKFTSEGDTNINIINRYSENLLGVNFHITEYQDTYGYGVSERHCSYDFEKFVESEDSVTFINVQKLFGAIELPSTVTFTKGNIKVIEDSLGNVIEIEVKKFIRKRDTAQLPSIMNYEDNQPIVGFALYSFYPKDVIKSNSISNKGIFKRILSKR